MTTHDLDNVIADLYKTAPENLWLQIDHEADPVDGWEFKTWCEYEENDTDLEYIRADLVESLRQQLSESQAELNEFRKNAKVGFDRQLRDQQKLAAALAAIKVKDALLTEMLLPDRDWPIMDKQIVDALAIQPDDSALKAWLGEPIWVAQSEILGQFINTSPRKVWYECLQGVGTPLYAPKGMK